MLLLDRPAAAEQMQHRHADGEAVLGLTEIKSTRRDSACIFSDVMQAMYHNDQGHSA